MEDKKLFGICLGRAFPLFVQVHGIPSARRCPDRSCPAPPDEPDKLVHPTHAVSESQMVGLAITTDTRIKQLETWRTLSPGLSVTPDTAQPHGP